MSATSDDPGSAHRQHDPVEHLRAHVLSQIGIGFVDDGGGQAVTFAPGPALIGDDGHVDFGALGIMFDLASSTAFGPGQMRPFVHADIAVHRLRAPDGPMIATARAARAGQRTGIVEVELRDQAGGLVATSTQEIVFKGPANEPSPEMARIRASFRSMFDGTCTMDRPLPDELGIVRDQPGVWSMALRPERSNGFGGLHGGVATSLVEVAASAAVGPDARTVSAAVRYLAPAMAGPFLAQPAVLVETGDLAVVQVPVIDAGADDRLVILATAHVTASASA